MSPKLAAPRRTVQEIPFDELQWAGLRLLGAEWIFAKTMPHDPHYYTLRRTWKADEFERVVQLIRDHGYHERYGGRWYTAMNVNGFKFWTMGAPAASTILINRKPADAPTAYDLVADWYDSNYQDQVSKAENAAVAEMLGSMESETVLDIGCGTGLLLELAAAGSAYLGIDPSARMLEQLRAKHGPVPVIQCRLEEFVNPLPAFDAVVGLFGSPSHVRPEYLVEAVTKLLRPGGRFFLMFYRPGYRPKIYDNVTGAVEFTHFDTASSTLEALPGPTHVAPAIGNFLVAWGFKP